MKGIFYFGYTFFQLLANQFGSRKINIFMCKLLSLRGIYASDDAMWL